MISIGYDIDGRFIIIIIIFLHFSLTKQDSIVVNIISGYLKFKKYVFTLPLPPSILSFMDERIPRFCLLCHEKIAPQGG